MQGEQRLSGYFISRLFSRLEWRIAATLITSDASLHTPHATYCLFTFGSAHQRRSTRLSDTVSGSFPRSGAAASSRSSRRGAAEFSRSDHHIVLRMCDHPVVLVLVTFDLQQYAALFPARTPRHATGAYPLYFLPSTLPFPMAFLPPLPTLPSIPSLFPLPAFHHPSLQCARDSINAVKRNRTERICARCAKRNRARCAPSLSRSCSFSCNERRGTMRC